MRRGRNAACSPVLFGGSNPPEVTTFITQGEVGKCWPAPTNLEVGAAETPEPFPPAFVACCSRSCLYFRSVVDKSAMRKMGGSSRCLVTNVGGTIVVPCLSLAGSHLKFWGRSPLMSHLSIEKPDGPLPPNDFT